MTNVSFLRKLRMHSKSRAEIKELKQDIQNLDPEAKGYDIDVSIFTEMINLRKRYTFF